MLIVDKTNSKDFFGRYQKAISTFFFTLYQLVLYVAICLIIYAVVTLNLTLSICIVFIFIVQLPLRRNQSYINFVNKCIQPLKYFDHFQFIFEQLIQAKDKCIFGVHPHSIYGISLLSLINSTNQGPLSNLIGLSSRFALNFPIVGAVLKLWGIQAVDHKNLKRLMRQGKNIGLIPGGFEEATITSANQVRCWIQNRKGFIKYSIEHGYTVYPVIMMNQHKAFWTFQPLLKFRLLLNKLKFPAVIFWNKWTGLLVPPWINMHTIIGKGIRPSRPHTQGTEVKAEQVEQTHKAYVAELMRIYNKYAHLNGNCPIKLY